MPRVKIDTPGVTIELDANETSVTELGKQAMDMYREATEIHDKNGGGPAYGLNTERRAANTLGFGSRWSHVQPTSEAP